MAMGTQRGLAGLLEPWGGLKAEPMVKISFLTPQLNRDSSLPLQASLMEAGDFDVWALHVRNESRGEKSKSWSAALHGSINYYFNVALTDESALLPGLCFSHYEVQ